MFKKATALGINMAKSLVVIAVPLWTTSIESDTNLKERNDGDWTEPE